MHNTHLLVWLFYGNNKQMKEERETKEETRKERTRVSLNILKKSIVGRLKQN